MKKRDMNVRIAKKHKALYDPAKRLVQFKITFDNKTSRYEGQISKCLSKITDVVEHYNVSVDNKYCNIYFK